MRIVRYALPSQYTPAEDSGAIIHFVNDARNRSDYYSSTPRDRRGRTLTGTKTGARFGINMIPDVSDARHMRYMTITGHLNADASINFLKQIISPHDFLVMIVTDGQPASYQSLW